MSDRAEVTEGVDLGAASGPHAGPRVTDDPPWLSDEHAVAIAHDYLTTVGGAERVVVSLTRTFPAAQVFTSLYEPSLVTPELGPDLDVHPSPLNRLRPLRRNYRAALPLLGPTFHRTRVDAGVVVCSSSGWSHGITTPGRKVVYCYNPARWLYQLDDYAPPEKRAWRTAATAMRPFLLRWDRRAAASCHRYVAVSTLVARRIRDAYGIEATVLSPPTTFEPEGPRHEIPGIQPGFMLCVNRLVPHKNPGAVVKAFASLRDQQLVLVGDGPELARLRASATPNVHFTGRASDATLRWAYANCAGMVSASHEDFGLIPLEVGAFGKPSAVLRFGGFLDSMIEGETATFFDVPEPSAIAEAVTSLRRGTWDPERISANAARFAEPRFIESMRSIVDEELRQVR